MPICPGSGEDEEIFGLLLGFRPWVKLWESVTRHAGLSLGLGIGYNCDMLLVVGVCVRVPLWPVRVELGRDSGGPSGAVAEVVGAQTGVVAHGVVP